jgi:hypothetical protein
MPRTHRATPVRAARRVETPYLVEILHRRGVKLVSDIRRD